MAHQARLRLEERRLGIPGGLVRSSILQQPLRNERPGRRAAAAESGAVLTQPWLSRQRLAGLLLVAYLVMTHAAVLTGTPRFAQAAWLGLAGLVAAVIPGKWGPLAGAALAGSLWVVDAETLLKFPPVVIDLAVAAWFGMSLRPGEEPLVSWFARLVRGGELAPDLARYARTSTLVWTVFLVAMAAVAAALALFASTEAWSLFANGISYLLLGGLFLGEYFYRRLRFPHHSHESLDVVVRSIMRGRTVTPRRRAPK